MQSRPPWQHGRGRDVDRADISRQTNFQVSLRSPAYFSVDHELKPWPLLLPSRTVRIRLRTIGSQPASSPPDWRLTILSTLSMSIPGFFSHRRAGSLEPFPVVAVQPRIALGARLVLDDDDDDDDGLAVFSLIVLSLGCQSLFRSFDRIERQSALSRPIHRSSILCE